MSKVTFRADDDLVARLEDLETSKSEAMREALREYLDRQAAAEATPDRKADAAADAGSTPEVTPVTAGDATLDEVVATRIDALLEPRVDRLLEERRRREGRSQPQPIDLTVNVDGVRERTGSADAARAADTADASESASTDAAETDCGQCGETLSDDHVYCPNCGEKRSHRVFCDCGDEVRSDWAFCPRCGRRTPAADVLDRP